MDLQEHGAATARLFAPPPAGSDLVRVFHHEPDLLAGVEPRVAACLTRAAVAPRLLVSPGTWQPPDDEATQRSFGLLVLDGLMTRTIDVSGRDCPELVGTGDLLRPWDRCDADALVPERTTWHALEPTTLAVLDERFAAIVCRCPPVVAALLSRAVQRSREVAFQLAIAHVRRAETRLLMLLWHLGDRFGRVTRDGVHVPVRLTHELIAQLTCMRRPTVTSTLQRLSRDGEVVRRTDGTWLLAGTPPALREQPRVEEASA